jgi:hypothetical protein
VSDPSSATPPKRRLGPLVSPAGLLAPAIGLSAAYGAAHLAGLRDFTAVLSGTDPPGGGGPFAEALGLGYVLLHFGFVAGAPILAIAAAIFAVLARSARPPASRA